MKQIWKLEEISIGLMLGPRFEVNTALYKSKDSAQKRIDYNIDFYNRNRHNVTVDPILGKDDKEGYTIILHVGNTELHIFHLWKDNVNDMNDDEDLDIDVELEERMRQYEKEAENERS